MFYKLRQIGIQYRHIVLNYNLGFDYVLNYNFACSTSTQNEIE